MTWPPQHLLPELCDPTAKSTCKFGCCWLLTGSLDSLYRRFGLGCFRLWLWWFVACCGSIHDFICSQSEVSYNTDAGMHDQRSGYLQQQHPVPGCFARYEWCTIRHDVDADASVAGSSPYASCINSSSSSNSSNPIEQPVPGLDAPPALSETFESW